MDKEENPYCTHCGSEALACLETYANGTEYRCKDCGTVSMWDMREDEVLSILMSTGDISSMDEDVLEPLVVKRETCNSDFDKLKEKILALCTLTGIVPCEDIGETVCLLHSHINDLTALKLDTERLEWLSFAISKGLTLKSYGTSWIIWDCRKGLEKVSFAEDLRDAIDIAKEKFKEGIKDV